VDENGGNGKLKMIGAVLGAAVVVVSGGIGFLQFREPRAPLAVTDSDVVQRIVDRLSNIDAMAEENRHRIEALEKPGGTTPMARETRERFEALDRVLVDVQRQMLSNTQRIDALLSERRGR
jgi:hypothetical protein